MSRYRPFDSTPLTAAQAKLVSAHIKWADAGARKYAYRWRRFVTEDDLRSAAYLGLVLAARKFDPSRKLAFKTLAFTYCESLMRREIDTLRRLDGCAFDPRVEGGMRVVAARTAWPTWADGTLRDIESVPPCVEVAAAEEERMRVARQRARRSERTLVKLVIAGYSAEEIAVRLRRSKRSVMARINNITRRLRKTDQVKAAA